MLKSFAVTIAVLTLLAQTPEALAQAVGSKVEISPLGLNSQWLPGTVTSITPGGDYNVRLDPREGYGDHEEYIVQKRWVRGAAQAPIQEQAGNINRQNEKSTRAAGAYKIGDIVNASPFALRNQWFPGQIIGFVNGTPVVRITRPGMNRSEDHVISPQWLKGAEGADKNTLAIATPAMPQLHPARPNLTPTIGNPANPGANTGSRLKVGDRVRYSPQFSKNENTWIMGTITSIEGGGSYGVKSDAKGPTNPSLFHTVREDFIKQDNTTAPKLAGPGNFPTTNKPIPTHETPVRPGSDCTPNEARYKAILEDHHRYNYGINYDQVDVSWDSFAIGAERKISTPQFNAPRAWMVNASYRVRAIRRYEQGGRKYVKTVVYQYAQPLLIFYVNDNGNCVFGGIDKSAGTLVYDQTDLVSQAQFDAAHKIVYACPNYLTCKCRKS